MKRRHFFALSLIPAVLLLFGCGKTPSPIDKIREALKGVPSYSIVLDDMKESGNFFKSYFHKYQIITDKKITTTDWMEASEDFYRKNLAFLGMTLWVKQDGKETSANGPPGYAYVGNSWYGRWERDSSGRSFWVFYGQYRLLSDLLGPGPMYRSYYSTYTDYRTSNRPYYGPRREYGTQGSFTRQQKPNFYSRRMSSMNASKASFSDKVNKRVGRTRTSVRSRGSGVGK
jgi:hypothetical protein